MARKLVNPPASEMLHLQDGNFVLDIPRESLKQLVSVRATSNAILLVDVGARVSIEHEGSDPALNDGKPMTMPFNYQVTVRITREPLNDGERDRIAAVAAAQKLDKQKRLTDEQTKREHEVAEVVRRTTEAMEHGMAIARAKNPENDLAQTINKIIGEKVKTALGA